MSDKYTSYIVRCSWDTGWEDHDFSDLVTARKFQKKEIALLYGQGVQQPEKWVKIYRLEETA